MKGFHDINGIGDRVHGYGAVVGCDLHGGRFCMIDGLERQLREDDR